MTTSTASRDVGRPTKFSIRALVGAGDTIMTTVAPVLVVGLVLNVWRPEWFSVGGPSEALAYVAWAILGFGVVGWLSSVALILTKVPRGELITTGPFALVKHPLYTAVSLLVLPAAGILLNTWLGVLVGAVMYLASRRFAPAEERGLAEEFGAEWDAYDRSVMLPWL